jgi:hypothetical protein
MWHLRIVEQTLACRSFASTEMPLQRVVDAIRVCRDRATTAVVHKYRRVTRDDVVRVDLADGQVVDASGPAVSVVCGDLSPVARRRLKPLVRMQAGCWDLDRAAVHAAVTLPYHNGGTEGVNTKTKGSMRQMQGRAGFTLLRHRILIG